MDLKRILEVGSIFQILKRDSTIKKKLMPGRNTGKTDKRTLEYEMLERYYDLMDMLTKVEKKKKKKNKK